MDLPVELWMLIFESMAIANWPIFEFARTRITAPFSQASTGPAGDDDDPNLVSRLPRLEHSAYARARKYYRINSASRAAALNVRLARKLVLRCREPPSTIPESILICPDDAVFALYSNHQAIAPIRLLPKPGTTLASLPIDLFTSWPSQQVPARPVRSARSRARSLFEKAACCHCVTFENGSVLRDVRRVELHVAVPEIYGEIAMEMAGVVREVVENEWVGMGIADGEVVIFG